MINPVGYWFIFQDDSLLLFKTDNTLLCDRESALMEPHFKRHLKLGRFNQVDYHSAEISNNVEISSTLHALPLRQALSLLDPDIFSVAVKAYSIINWDKNHPTFFPFSSHDQTNPLTKPTNNLINIENN